MTWAPPDDSRWNGALVGGWVRRLPHLPRLPPDLERRFQAEYYVRIRPTLRLVSLLLAVLASVQTLLQPRTLAPFNAAQIVFWLCVLGVTWAPSFRRIWQPGLVVLSWVMALFVLGGLGPALAGAITAHAREGRSGPTGPQQEFFFLLQLTALMLSLSTLRLPFRWMALLQGGVTIVGLWSLAVNIPPTRSYWDVAPFILLPVIIVLLVILLAAFTQELLARVAFWASYQLEQERDVERRGREQTEGQLRILARAIGGIVHDLGNPLTVVQLSAETLARQNASSDVVAIQESVEVLSALRLSLIEQGRVLEGKPVVADLRAEELRPIIEKGARLQNRVLLYKRTVSLAGEDMEIYADRLKLATVFMNLIGNSLKYSKGDVRVVWRATDEAILVGILDQGTAGQGISEVQARRLFVAFGRLEVHTKQEGTGLGLVSARKTVEAHGGAIFIEGHEDGTLNTRFFTTAEKPYPSVLEAGFLTGFVIALPV